MIQLTLFQWLLIISTLLLVIVLVIKNTYNAIIRKRNQVKTDYSDIDVQLKRRSSLIQNLVDLVKDYAKHEKGTFENVSKARSAVDTSSGAHESAKAENMLSQTLRSLFSVVENYPKLQASENYKTLQDDLKATENYIARYREEYNASVQEYNNYIQTFPNLLIASLFGFHDEQLYQASEE